MLLAAIGRVQDLRRADRRQVAVALVADDDAAGQRALDAGGHRRGASMRDLHVADIEVVVRKHRAADRAHQDGPVLDAQFVDRPRDQLVRDAVPAARAVVRLVLVLGLALDSVGRRRRRFVMENLELVHAPTSSNTGPAACRRATSADKLEHLFRRRNVAALPAVELDRPAALDGEPYILDHLAGAEFDHCKCLQPGGPARRSCCSRERKQRDRPQQPDLQALSRGPVRPPPSECGRRCRSPTSTMSASSVATAS